jgi:hypothetical protein
MIAPYGRRRTAVLGRVHELVEAALRHLGGVLEVGEQVFLRAVEQLDLDVLAEVDAVDDELEAAPGALELLELRVVEDLVDLPRELLSISAISASTKALSTFSPSRFGVTSSAMKACTPRLATS